MSQLHLKERVLFTLMNVVIIKTKGPFFAEEKKKEQKYWNRLIIVSVLWKQPLWDAFAVVLRDHWSCSQRSSCACRRSGGVNRTALHSGSRNLSWGGNRVKLLHLMTFTSSIILHIIKPWLLARLLSTHTHTHTHTHTTWAWKFLKYEFLCLTTFTRYTAN